MSSPQLHPHRDQPVLTAGTPLELAKAAVIMLHGRGATAADILGLSTELPAQEIAYLAPQAANNSWYPQRFLAPLDSNQPWLDSALQIVSDLVQKTAAAGIPTARLVLLGFSQGACLALEYAVRQPQRYGAVIGLSGGLIGPIGNTWNPTASFDKTPVLLGCSDVDPHIPLSRVKESAAVFARRQAQVDLRIYPGMGHTVNLDELQAVERVLLQIAPAV